MKHIYILNWTESAVAHLTHIAGSVFREDMQGGGGHETQVPERDAAAAAASGAEVRPARMQIQAQDLPLRALHRMSHVKGSEHVQNIRVERYISFSYWGQALDPLPRPLIIQINW